ncbi:hypothetical protein PENSPDRAFT_759643 [Peniophora sp. CONT]|nr:hypothetical protein PENSPDRAFT_759643 [Peniophora sp. CONT]
MFASASTSPLVSLFSSSSSEPLALFSVHTDISLPSDSFAHLLDDATSEPAPPDPASAISPHPLDSERGNGRELTQTVLHLQSPTLRTTYIRCPPQQGRERDLELGLPWLHLQVRNLGREWSFEVGVVDVMGKNGTIRCSTFQRHPSMKRTKSRPPLLHLPLSFPTASSTPLTTWATVSLHLPSLMPHFSSPAFEEAREDYGDDRPDSPRGRYSHSSFVKVYATCRLRRIWFSQQPIANGAEKPWELQLYAES